MSNSYISKIRRRIDSGVYLKPEINNLKQRISTFVRYNDIFYFLDYKRILTKNFIAQFPTHNSNHQIVGNYYIDKTKNLNSSSVIYSFGVLAEISFDKAIADLYGCNVYLFDPSPISIEFMSTVKNDRLKYFPNGVWIENKTFTFFVPKGGGSSSMVFNYTNGASYEAQCKTIAEIMSENHHEKIDVLKMDIEGAALPLMQYLLDKKIYPEQIVAEFERPEGVNELIDFFADLKKVVSSFKDNGYSVFTLPREEYNYFSLELLFVR